MLTSHPAALVNPLCKAVLAGDHERVTEILRLAPDYIGEKTIFGRSAIDLAAYQPACLRILLQHVKPQLTQRSQVSAPPLAALQLSSVDPCPIHWGDDPAGDPECHSSECVTLDLYLAAGCEQLLDDLRVDSWRRASPHAKRIYLLHMRRRRQALTYLALVYLPKAQIESLGVSTTTVLDANVVAVIVKLRALKVQLSPVTEILYRDYTCATAGGSIYHYIQNVNDAELAWDLGFRDVTALDKDGRVPTVKTGNISYIHWLYAHGVDMFSPCCWGTEETGVGTTVAHYVASLAGPELSNGHHQSKVGHTVAELAPIIFSDVTDCCECRCSQQGGCSPMLCGLKEAFRESENVLDVCEQFLNAFPDRLDLGLAMAVTRLITFEAFSLPHSCCRFEDGGVKRDYIAMEIVDLDQIFSEEIERFEECIGILFRELETLQHSASINALIFKEFLHTTWNQTMKKEQTLKPDIGAEEEVLSGAAELGVVWRPTVPDEAPDFTSLEYWVGEIDKILEGKDTTYQEYGVV
ncbi:hypothetical protein PG991_013933 [Apiospora marii]|uniref:Ankyrin repeat protein n=1 Tax=Apiospora marii TaxID=335849 RepID=A0ABR1R8A0_9PEZI